MRPLVADLRCPTSWKSGRSCVFSLLVQVSHFLLFVSYLLLTLLLGHMHKYMLM